MANLNVTYQDLHDAATKLTSGHDEISTKLNELKGYIDGLVSHGYVTDQSSGAFHDKYTEFTTSSHQLNDSLTGLSSFLTQAANALQEADAQLAQSIRG